MATGITILDPTNESTPAVRQLLARPASVKGLTVGLLDISKPRGNVFLNRIEELLTERGAKVLRFSKPTFTKPAPVDLRQEIATQCNLVIEALADWGSCTSCSVHDISDLELRGVPGVFVATEEFISAGAAQSVALGMPSMKRVYTTHPVQDRTDEEMIAMADQFFLEILACITSGDWQQFFDWPVPKYPRRVTPPTKILMLRHGQSEWNALGRWQGQADIELTDLGYEQARRAAQKLGMFDAIASSDLRRSRITATYIAEGLGIGLLDADPRFRETDVGEWQGLTHDQIERDWPGYLEAHNRPPGFESDISIVTRVTAALVDLAEQFPGGEVLVVAHAGVIRVMRRSHRVGDSRIPNLGGCEFIVRPDATEVITVGDVVELFEHGEIGEEL